MDNYGEGSRGYRKQQISVAPHSAKIIQTTLYQGPIVHPTSMATIQRNNVRVVGEGSRVLMFAHGYGCDQSMWRSVTPAFEEDYKIVLFDYVGAGNSDLSAFDRTRYSTLRGYAKDVLEIIAALDLALVNFVGHSVSSMIGALAAIEKPEAFESVVMIGPSPCYINSPGYTGGFERTDIDDLLEQLAANHLGWSAAMAPVIMGNPEHPELAAELEASFCRTNPKFAQHFARVTFLSDNREDVASLKSRVLILQCDQDAIAPPSVGEYLHQCLPESEYVLMKATGHCPHLSAPAEVIRAMRQFL
jgi:sigma-B regulation protein RsbQ